MDYKILALVERKRDLSHNFSRLNKNNISQVVDNFWVYLGVKTCEVFLCFVTIIFVLSFVLTSLFSLFYVARDGDRFLHQG